MTTANTIVEIVLALWVLILALRVKRLGRQQRSEALQDLSSCYHVWGKWIDHNRQLVARDSGRVISEFDAQKRICETCGYREVRTVAAQT